jgi:hypothetical protein
MSNHFSAANLKSPGGDPRLDFTDLFAFEAPRDPGKTVLIADFCPFRDNQLFHPQAVYRINIDNDGDAREDVAFTFTFSQPDNEAQTGTAHYATGSQARESEPAGDVIAESIPVGLSSSAQPMQVGDIQIFAGVRSDPFFADAEAPFHDFKWTGKDTFAGKNVLSIALEVPNDMLSQQPVIGAWGTISLHKDGELVQMDRGGNPTINPFINSDDMKDEYNARQPADDVPNYLEPWSKFLEDKGGYSPADAKTVALEVLPDILRYDRAEPAAYPNGRVPTDDVYSYRFAWMSKGKIPPDGLEPHRDLIDELPYLGVPIE